MPLDNLYSVAIVFIFVNFKTKKKNLFRIYSSNNKKVPYRRRKNTSEAYCDHVNG